MFSFSKPKTKLLTKIRDLKSQTEANWSAWRHRGLEILHNSQGAADFVITSLSEETRHFTGTLYAEAEAQLRGRFPRLPWPDLPQVFREHREGALDLSLAPLAVTHDSHRTTASLLRDPFTKD